jgi:hypothetical protein
VWNCRSGTWSVKDLFTELVGIMIGRNGIQILYINVMFSASSFIESRLLLHIHQSFHYEAKIPRLYKANLTLQKRLDELLERTVDRRAERLDLLVEVNGGLSTLGNAFGGELEFLQSSLASYTCAGCNL